MKKQILSAFAATAILGWGSSASAAVIIWGTPTAIYDANDVSTTGTSALAYTYNTTNKTVNGVIFENLLTQSGITLIFSGSNGNGPYFAPDAGGGSATPNTLTGDYKSMINWGAWSTTSFSFTGLIEGQQYQLQFWAADYRGFDTQYSRSETLTAGNTSGELSQLHTDGGVNLGSVSGSYILGTFTADVGGTQSITINEIGGGDSMVNGIQLRAIPEPSAALLGGLGLLALLRRRRA